jgi:hypothetical protein
MFVDLCFFFIFLLICTYTHSVSPGPIRFSARVKIHNGSEQTVESPHIRQLINKLQKYVQIEYYYHRQSIEQEFYLRCKWQDEEYQYNERYE